MTRRQRSEDDASSGMDGGMLPGAATAERDWDDSRMAAAGADECFGAHLKRAREGRGLTLLDIAMRTKVSRTTLVSLEEAKLADLPAGVYVRGFIRSYARAVGVAETRPLLLYEHAIEAKRAAEQARAAIPVPVPDRMQRDQGDDDDGSMGRRGVGLAVFVIILLIIATITLSFVLRRPPQSGEGLSLNGRPSGRANATLGVATPVAVSAACAVLG